MKLIAALLLVLALGALAPAGATPDGQMTWAVHTTLVPSWFDPAETIIGSSFLLLYALHDAVVKPMPGHQMSPSLAESWTASRDGLVYEFILRRGVKFHDGSSLTAEDVKFSFERYRGVFSAAFRERVAAVETPDARRVRFRLKQPWPDFMTFYGTTTAAAGWVVPKKYVEKVGPDGFKKAPIGAGPYRFVSFTPGVELVLEAFDGYWRKTPEVKRLVLRVVPDPATRIAALRRGEVDVAYSMPGEFAEQVKQAGLTLKAVYPSVHWLYFADQWDPKSPWHDRRVRLAANFAIDRAAIGQVRTFGLSKITGSIFPSTVDFYWAPPPPAYDPPKAKALLAEAGYPNGLDAGDYYCDMTSSDAAEMMVTFLQAAGIRTKLRPIERAAFNKSIAEKKLKNLVQVIAGVNGNAATRLEEFVITGGTFVYGGSPDLDGLFREQAAETDRGKRQAILHRMQQLVHERAIFAPIYELAFLNGVGARVEEPGFGLITSYAFSAPYEDVRLKRK